MLEHADEAVRLASADARAARSLARSVLSSASDVEARSAAERALGLAAIELGEADAAVMHLRRAVVLAVDGGLKRRAGEARMSLSWALTQQGDIASALVEASRALPSLEGASRARMLAQRATILQRLGRFSESLDEYRSALTALRRADDVLWEARLLCNRGVLHVHLGSLGAAEADLLRAEGLHESISQTLAATQVRHNLGWVAARRGDVPAGAGLVRPRRGRVPRAGRAARAAADGPLRRPALRAAGGRGTRQRPGGGDRTGGGRTWAPTSPRHACWPPRPSCCAGDAAAAREHALQADTTFARQGRTAWTALARAAAARAAWMEVETARAKRRGRAARPARAARRAQRPDRRGRHEQRAIPAHE